MAEVKQNLNQFKQTPLVGQPDLTVNQNIVPARILATSTGGALLVAGNGFKLSDTAGPVPIVDLIADATEQIWGVAIHNMKRDTFVAGDYLDLALVGSTVWMQTSAAIARGAKVQLDPTGPTIATLTNKPNNCSIGYTIDKPTAANALCRVYLNPQDGNQSAY